jgi:hypothetical protein
MFMDITHYKSKRKGKRGPIPLDVPREPAGRASRSAVDLVHMVYFVALDGTSRVKVGKTQNIKQRLMQYRHGSGCEARCLVQLIVASAEDSLNLERDAIRVLRSKYERAGREWFLMPHAHLAAAVAEILASSPVVVIEQRGAPGQDRERNETFQTINELKLMARHNRGHATRPA